jgi:high affinity sulfate transporter 1
VTDSVPARPAGWRKYLPILSWLPAYPPSWLRRDIVAGLTTAAVVIPQAMAYAALAGLPVEVGLYAALTPMVVYVLIGTSRVMSVSVTSTISLLTATVLATTLSAGAANDILVVAATLAVLVGVLLILASLLRLGFLANFISAPVLAGFKAGIGLVIVVSQMSKTLGYTVSKGGFMETVVETLQRLDETTIAAVLVTLLVLAILILLPRFSRRVPAALVAVAVAMAAASVLNLMGAEVKLVGEIPAGLPSVQLPDWRLAQDLFPGALGIALMSFTESIAAARAFADQSDPPVDADQELLALGMANLAGGLLQAYPGGGGTSQTAVNQESGAKSQVAGLVTALVVALTLLVLAPVVSLIPNPALATLVMVSAVGLVNVEEFRAIGRYRMTELIWALVAFGGVLFLGTLEGILIAVLLSMVTLLYAANHPPVYIVGRKPDTEIFRSLDDHPGDETFPGLLVLRTEGGMNFASAPRVQDAMQELVLAAHPQVVILECSAIRDFEYTAFTVLERAERNLAAAGIALWLTGLNPEPLRRIRRSSLGRILGDDRLFPTLRQAVSHYMDQYPKHTQTGGAEADDVPDDFTLD